jgi:hypothetical protein
MDKLFITADELLKDSFKLAWMIFESGFKRDAHTSQQQEGKHNIPRSKK